jgi:hypothetical protein
MEPGQWNTDTEPDQTGRTVFGTVCEQRTKTTLLQYRAVLCTLDSRLGR